MKRKILLISLVFLLTLQAVSGQSLGDGRSITIANLDDIDKVYLQFMSAHPEIEVRFAGNYLTDDQVLQSIMTQSDAIDIYCLNVNGLAFRSLYRRDFLAPIDDLAMYTVNMLPQVRSRIEKEGHLVALPYTSSTVGGFSYDPEVLTKIGLTADELPDNWIDLFGFIDEWTQQYAADYPEIALFEPSTMEDVRRTVFYTLYNDYCTHLDAFDQPNTFDTPLFRRLLSAFEAVDFQALEAQYGNGADWWEGDILFGRDDDIGFVQTRENANQSLALKLDEDTGPYYAMTLYVCIINPYSKNQDIASTYLHCAAEHMEDYTRYSLAPDEAVPLRSESYEEVKGNFSQAIEELTLQASELEAADRIDLDMQIDDLEKRWAHLDETLWIVNDALISRYAQQAPHIVVYNHGMIGGFDGMGEDGVHAIIERFIAGQFDRDMLISQLDQRVMLEVMEWQ